MTGATLEKVSQSVSAFRQLLEYENFIISEELKLQTMIMDFLHSRPDSMRWCARQMVFSAAYLSDVCARRRRISDHILDKLEELNDARSEAAVSP